MSFTTAVIGAGVSGISSALALRSVGSMVTCFEVSSTIGGAWNYVGNSDPYALDNFSHQTTTDGLGVGSPLSPLHPSFRCALPKDFMAFSDHRFPFPVAHFPHHSAVRHYVHDYAYAKGAQALIRFNTLVERVEYDEHRKQWFVRTVNIKTGDVMAWWFDSVVVASGKFHRPRLPLIPMTTSSTPFSADTTAATTAAGAAPPPRLIPRTMPPVLGQEDFENSGGVILHSSDLKRFREWRGKTVVVVGDGCGAAEAVKELRRHGAFAVHTPSIDGVSAKLGGGNDDAASVGGSTDIATGTTRTSSSPADVEQSVRYGMGKASLRWMKWVFGSTAVDGAAKDAEEGAVKGSTLIARMMHGNNVRNAPLPLPIPTPSSLEEVLGGKKKKSATSDSTANTLLSSLRPGEFDTYASSPGFVKMPSLGPLVGFGPSAGTSPALDARSVVLRFPSASGVAAMLRQVTGRAPNPAALATSARSGDPFYVAGTAVFQVLQAMPTLGRANKASEMKDVGMTDWTDLWGWSPLRRHSIRRAAKVAAVLDLFGITPAKRTAAAATEGDKSAATSAATEYDVVLKNVSAVVFCTGYYSSYPYLADDIRVHVEKGSLKVTPVLEISAGTGAPQPATTTPKPEDKEPTEHFDSLYMGAIYMHNPSLAFVGAPTNLIPPFSILEVQAKFVAYVLSKRVDLPATISAMKEREETLYGISGNMLSSVRGCGVGASMLYYEALKKEIAGDHPVAIPAGGAAGAAKAAAEADAVPQPEVNRTPEIESARLRTLRAATYWDHLGWQRFWWYAATSFVSLVHKVRSYAPLKRKEQHRIISNTI